MIPYSQSRGSELRSVKQAHDKTVLSFFSTMRRRRMCSAFAGTCLCGMRLDTGIHCQVVDVNSVFGLEVLIGWHMGNASVNTQPCLLPVCLIDDDEEADTTLKDFYEKDLDDEDDEDEEDFNPEGEDDEDEDFDEDGGRPLSFHTPVSSVTTPGLSGARFSVQMHSP